MYHHSQRRAAKLFSHICYQKQLVVQLLPKQHVVHVIVLPPMKYVCVVHPAMVIIGESNRIVVIKIISNSCFITSPPLEQQAYHSSHQYS